MEAILDSDRKHWVSVAAAIVDGERVLAVRRRDNGKWEPPGGTLEPNEEVLEGLQREVREEIGLTIKEPQLSGVYKNMTRSIVALVFRCKHEGTPQLTAEVEDVLWMTSDEINEKLDPAYACRLLDALESEPPAIRSHDGTNLIADG